MRINKKLLRHTDKLLSTGNLWLFLKRIDEDYRKYQKTIFEIKERENLMAATFVSMVRLFKGSTYCNFSGINCEVSLCQR